jgi:hypothetical protein
MSRIRLTISQRDEYGRLYLPWYVARDARERVIAGPLEHWLDVAKSIQVSETADAEHSALRHVHTDPVHGAWTHEMRIAHHMEQMIDARRTSLLAPAWDTPEGPVLRDCCHRVCALYRLDPPEWELEIELHPPSPHVLDAAAELRA